MLYVYESILFFDGFFAFCAKFNGQTVAVDFDSFFLQVWLIVAGGFAVTVADCVAAHFTFSA